MIAAAVSSETLAQKTPAKCEPGPSLLQRQQDVTLVSAGHQISFPVSELSPFCNANRALMDGHTVRDSRFPLSVAGSAASSGFSLSPILGQAIASSGTAEDMTIDSLCADDVIPSVQFHPTGDLFGGPSRSKTVLPMIAQAGGTLDLRPPKFADPGSAVRAIRSLSVCVAVARQFPMDRPPMPSQTPRHLRHRHVHFHQPPQATSFFKRKGIVSRSHSDPRYTRWRTWCVNLATPICAM